MTEYKLDKLSFLEKEPKGIHLLMFSARWCGSCREMKTKLADKGLPIPAYEVDVDTQQGGRMGNELNIRALPTWCVMDSGKLLDKKMGTMNTNDFFAWLDKYK